MKIHLDMVGCRLNQAEIESMARQFRTAGHLLVADAGSADLVVVNTCAVTSDAVASSRQKIRAAGRSGGAEIVATGCWASLAPEEAAKMPGVQRVVPNALKDSLVPDVLGLPAEAFDAEPISREPLPGLRHRTRAFIKVQDGCDNRCTFCLTTLARGEGRSRPIAAVVEDVRRSLAGGAREAVLTGVHLGSWGYDLDLKLHDLVRALLADTDVARLRLSSLEPWDLQPDFFSLWSDPRLCPHLHLPLQSGSAATLRRMARRTTPASFRALVAQARAAIPGVAITTDVIAGFPGETAAEFDESLEFVRSIQFAGGHVFSYSSRPGTTAARMPGHLPAAVKKIRNAALREVLDESANAYRRAFIGRMLPVLWEAAAERSEHGWRMEGWTGNYIRVTALTPEPRWNCVDDVWLAGLAGDGMRGNAAC